MFELRQVASKKDVQEFHLVQDRIYAGDSRFIKPIQKDIEDIFNPETNPAFLDGDAARFVLYHENIPAGRIAVFYRIKEGKAPVGGIGFFECIQNQDAAFYMFDFAVNWLKSKGCTYMDGPVNFWDRDSFWGLLIEIKTYPSYRESYQPAYYKAFFENYGFEKIIEQSTSDITENEFNFERFSKLSSRVFQNPDYSFRTLDYSEVDKYASDFAEIYNQAWSFHEDFKPVTKEKILERLKQMKPVLPSDFAIFAYSGARPIGFYISILEVNQIFKQFNGQLSLWNKIKFLLQRKKINKVKGIIFGIVPDFHNLGIETGMIMKFYESLQKYPQIKAAELAWIGDFNPKMLSMLRSLGAYTTKIHYTFRKIF